MKQRHCWKEGVQESNGDVNGGAHHRADVGDNQHRSYCREADRRRKGVEVIETVHLREAASYEPRFVLIEVVVWFHLVMNILPRGRKHHSNTTRAFIAASSLSIAALHSRE